MGTITNITRTQLAVGDLVHHRLFEYRGAIVDVDPNFQSTVKWSLSAESDHSTIRKFWFLL